MLHVHKTSLTNLNQIWIQKLSNCWDGRLWRSQNRKFSPNTLPQTGGLYFRGQIRSPIL